MTATLNMSTVLKLAELAHTVHAGQPITWLEDDGRVSWGIARAFTHEGGGFLGASDDVRDGFVWLSGGSSFVERWVPVSRFLAGLADGSVSLDYRPDA